MFVTPHLQQCGSRSCTKRGHCPKRKNLQVGLSTHRSANSHRVKILNKLVQVHSFARDLGGLAARGPSLQNLSHGGIASASVLKSL
eukprot:3775368-Amphidinium_carterae.1